MQLSDLYRFYLNITSSIHSVSSFILNSVLKNQRELFLLQTQTEYKIVQNFCKSLNLSQDIYNIIIVQLNFKCIFPMTCHIITNTSLYVWTKLGWLIKWRQINDCSLHSTSICNLIQYLQNNCWIQIIETWSHEDTVNIEVYELARTII